MVTVLFINRIWQLLSLWSGHFFTHSLIKDLWVNDELITDIVTDLSQWDVTFWMKWFGVQKWLCHTGKYSLYCSLCARGSSPCVRGAHRSLFKTTGARTAISCDWKTILTSFKPVITGPPATDTKLLLPALGDLLFLSLLRTWPVIRLRQDWSFQDIPVYLCQLF